MPRFNRPDHEDFWLLSQVVIDNDTVADNETMPFEDRIGQVIDPESLTYMARQRALRVTGPFATTRDQAKFAAIYMDAFMAGATFQAEKIKRQNGQPSE